MKNNLLYNFLKEEVRLHTNLYNKSNFFGYPLVLILFFTIITSSMIYLFAGYNEKLVAGFTINMFFIGGVMSGAFGLYAQDFLERKFGDIGRLFSNTLILPIKLSKTFITMAISDIIFYLFWFILPTILGLTIGLIIMKESILSIPYLITASFLAFCIGIFLMFFISVVYQKNKYIFTMLIGIISIRLAYLFFFFNPETLSPVHYFYFTHNYLYLLLGVIIMIILAVLSYFTVGTNFETKTKKISETKSIKFSNKISSYITKDLIDLKRTGGLFGKPFFTVFVPAVLTMLLFTKMKILTYLKLDTIFFAIVLGILGTQLLNSLINSDNFAYYRFLPVTLKDYIKSKINLALIICFIQGAVLLIIYSIYTHDQISVLIKSIITLLAILLYTFNLNFYLTGLKPNENLMSAKIFIEYFLWILPLLFLSIIANTFFSNQILYFIIFCVLCYGISKLFFNLGIRKWDNKEIGD